MPTDYRELSFEVPPTDLISGVWTARTEAQRNQIQPAFNEFLRLRAAAQAEESTEDGQSYENRLSEECSTKTLFYMAGYALPLLERAAKDKDPFIREQAVLNYPYAAKAIDQLNSFIEALDKIGPRPRWATALTKNRNRNQADWRSFAIDALKDVAPNVRAAAVKVLTKTHWDQYAFDAMQGSIGDPDSSPNPWLARNDAEQEVARPLGAVMALNADPDPAVRTAVQDYLASFAGDPSAADAMAASLNDANKAVREQALSALLHSPEPPPLETIKRAFLLTKGPTAVGLIPLLFEQENAALPASLIQPFTARSLKERQAIMTTVAGHNDPATLELVKLGLNDPAPLVQRASLMRLLSFPATTAIPLLDSFTRSASAELRQVAQAVRQEIETRKLWPFLTGQRVDQISGSESAFPSQNGTMPVVSPDGQWIAYVETGWNRPGGSGGFGASNLLSISHAVRRNGDDDRIVSDMYLVGWLSDSSGVATARDSFAAVSDLNGKVVSEFGDPLEEEYRSSADPGGDWRQSELRQQFGGGMPHEKYIRTIQDTDFSAARACSPDGKWYGPIRRGQKTYFLGADGNNKSLRLPVKPPRFGFDAIWSPSGRYLLLFEDEIWLIFDMQTEGVNRLASPDSDDFPGGRGWTPWSKDGSRLALLRDGQVWISGANGENGKQLTFDTTRKAAPTFSRDGRFVAYITWQDDNRLHYSRLGPTDLWVVDTETTLVTRVTAPSPGRINSFDWLDDHTLIFDRLERDDDKSFRPTPRSSLRRLSLMETQNR
jgi:HEAT repeat protein